MPITNNAEQLRKTSRDSWAFHTTKNSFYLYCSNKNVKYGSNRSRQAQAVFISPNTKLEEILRIFDAQQKNKQKVKNAGAKERKAKLKKLWIPP